MDRDRFSACAHSSHALCNPIGVAKVAQAISLMSLSPVSKFLDIGAGKGEVSAMITEASGARGVAIERSPHMARSCRELLANRAPGLVTTIEQDAREALRGIQDRSFDAVICLGSTHALGSFDGTVHGARRVLTPAGWLLIADGYWKREPSPEYLDALVATRDSHATHAENIANVQRAGFEPRWAWTASEDEWDQYEWRYQWNIGRFVEEHPLDPDAEAMLARARGWREVVLRWGRETLGFGMILAQGKIDAPASTQG